MGEYMQERNYSLKLCPSCHAFQDAEKKLCPNCDNDLTNVPIYKSIKSNNFSPLDNLKSPMIGLGIVGFLLAGFIAFLVRPSAFLIGQLPFGIVITRGANLKGMDQLLIPLAQQSFNTMLIGAIIGAVSGSVIGYFIGKR